jgi:hypothetical protein
MFSKPQNKIGCIDSDFTNEFVEFMEENKNKIIRYSEYINNKDLLKKYKLNELKQIIRFYKLPLTGTKQVLKERIENFFNTYYNCVKIQKVFRGYLLRTSIKLRGEGYNNRKLCVNESDFYTLEPLKEIPTNYFFSFGCEKFVYGCNIISLIHLIKSKTTVKNPYNREEFSKDVIDKINKLYSLIKIIFGLPPDAPVIKNNTSVVPLIHQPYLILDSITENRVNKLRTIRSKSIPQRIHELFMEIDQLGNYTNSQWFSLLERRDYLRLYRTLFDIWNYRGQLTRETKLLICILGDPFMEVNRERINMYESGTDVLRECCLKIMEYMTYCGVDDEYRKIGALHVLTGLTNVSVGARHAMPWLYDTLI